MIETLVAVINLILLFTGIYALVTRLSGCGPTALAKLTSAVLSLIMLSFFYYLMLAVNQGFGFLLIVLTVINLSHIYYSSRIVRVFFRFKTVETKPPYDIVLPGAILLLTIFFVLRGTKNGGYDAWAIWNMHAKFLYDTGAWKRLLTKDLAYSHPDYPMMLPSLVAFFWKIAGRITIFVPVLLAYALLLIIPSAIYYAFRERRLSIMGIIALAIFIIDNYFKLVMLAQQADALLAVLMLFTFIQYQAIKAQLSNQAYLLGFICASCGWVKNEGLVFYILFAVTFFFVHIRNFRLLKQFLTGSIIPMLVIVSFKLFFSPPNDLIVASNGHLSLPATLMNPVRYAIIFKYWLNLLVDSFMLVAVLIGALLVFNRRFFISLPFIVILLLLLSYVLVYLTTPYDVQWHMANSLNRLLMQVVPSFVFLSLLALKDVNKVFLV